MLEVLWQVHRQHKRSLGILGLGAREGQKVTDSLRALRDEREHAEARLQAILEGLVESKFPEPALPLAGGRQRLGAVVQLRVELEERAARGLQRERCVGIEVGSVDAELQRVLPVEVAQLHTLSVGGHRGVNDEVGEHLCMVLAGDADLAKQSGAR